ncbi:uncharacterized protein [Pseudorca crassidens]|uniref:uncharacterized protein isoform X1 n=1 Tax=Pseudorca crassidens TaxID=82174 RepID=UPI0028C44525|nr:uncharacterized protein LOC132419986 [Delphinus delphis]
MGLASQALSACGLRPDLCPAPFPPPQSPQTACHHVLPGLPVRPSCTHESQALPCPRPRGRSGGCHLACRFCSCASLLAPSPVIAIPTSHLPPPKTRLQVSPSSTPWRRQSAEELDGRGRRVALDQRSFRTVTWHLTPTWRPATPSWFGLKPSRILRGTGPWTRHPSTLQLQNPSTATGIPARVPVGQAGPKDSGPGPLPCMEGRVHPASPPSD